MVRVLRRRSLRPIGARPNALPGVGRSGMTPAKANPNPQPLTIGVPTMRATLYRSAGRLLFSSLVVGCLYAAALYRLDH